MAEEELRRLAPPQPGDPAAASSSGRMPEEVIEPRALGRDLTIILVMSDATLPLSEIKKRLSEIVDGVESTHDRVVLTRNGRAAAVIISHDDLASLEESVEILSNPVAVRAIRKAEAEIDKGRALTADELRAKYLHR